MFGLTLIDLVSPIATEVKGPAHCNEIVGDQKVVSGLIE
jgi:hypothetical protein